MGIQFSSQFSSKLKRVDVRVRRSFAQAMMIFAADPLNSELDNKPLREPWQGHRSIRVLDVKNDYRAIYQEINTGDEVIALFVDIGTHKELYR